ncbi:MAG: metallophosphoesterase [Gammaproteobacteria bacterium]|nr:metallophosphoesterase [Gammaproteobacteria bacterium]
MKTSDARKHYLAEIDAQRRPEPGKKVRGTQGLNAMLRAVPQHPAGEFNEPDEDVLVCSDLHLGHENIIKYCDRPFLDVGDMNRTLWDYMHAALAPDKVLVVVGDLAMREALSAATWKQVRELDCRGRHLVLGNHDLTGAGQLRVQGFDHVWSLLVSGGEPPLIWTHYPLNEVPNGYINIHGHVHDNPPRQTPHINVSVEQLDYEPASLLGLRALAKVLVQGEYPAGKTTLARLQDIGVVKTALRR